MTLSLAERRWARAIESAAFGVWDLDPRLDLVHYSPQWKSRLGFPRIHAPDHSAFWRCRVHPEDFAPMLRTLLGHLDGSSPTYEVRFRLRSNGGGYRSVISRGRVVACDAGGQPMRMVGTMVDLKGWPAIAANWGLAAESPDLPAPPRGAPFHAIFGRAPGGTFAPDQDRKRLADQVGDLLDLALREADAAR